MTSQPLNNYLILIFSLCMISCGQLTGGHTGANDTPFGGTVGGLNFIETEQGRLLVEGSVAKDSGHAFNLKFKLPDGESIRFFFYSDRSLNGGVTLTFSRRDNELESSVKLNDTIHSTNLGEFGEVIDLVFDVHNDHEDAHLLLWESNSSFGDSEECVEDESCLYNTEYFNFLNGGPWGSQGRASGSYWGVEGDRNLIIELKGPLKAKSDA